MVLTLRLALIAAMIIYFALLLSFVIKAGLNLRFFLIWLIAGVFLLILIAFPNILSVIASLLGIQSEMNALLAAICFFIIIVDISLSATASQLNDKLIRTVQKTALLEKRISDLEEEIKELQA